MSAAKKEKKIPCHLCGGKRSRLVRAVPNHDTLHEKLFPKIYVSVCRDCGLIFQNPCISETLMSEVYSALEDKVTPAGAGTVTAAEAASRVDCLQRLRPAPARVLDAGCSDGTFLAAAREAGYEVVGIDPSRANIDKARQRFPGLRVEQTFLEDYHPSERFDVVCHFYILEYSFRPRVFLERARALIKPGGLMLFEAPDIAKFSTLPFANNLFSHQDISIFSPRTATSLLRATGFHSLGVNGPLGPASKAYGLRSAAQPAPAEPVSANSAVESVRLLERYFARREAVREKLRRRVGAWAKKIKSRPGPVVVFGAGENGRIVPATGLFKGRELLFCDNNKVLHGQRVDGLPVVSPTEVPSLEPALVIAASIDYQADMVRQMHNLGVPAARLVKLYQGF